MKSFELVSARLSLEDGSVFEGTCFGHRCAAAGEVVFNTGMVGYPEALSDPSYRGQLLVFTYPLQGNYGVVEEGRDRFGLPHLESDRVQAAGMIASESSAFYSHYTATSSLSHWLDRFGVPGIAGIDTRALTTKLREHGSMLGKIEVGADEVPFADPNIRNLVSEVSRNDTQTFRGNAAPADGTRPKLVLVDCGHKASIARALLERGVDIIRVPFDHYFLDMDFDGLVISNGPGDPSIMEQTTRHVEHALAVGKPILGICLGHQLLARAAGASTYKLKYGHRSQNQPCLEMPPDAAGPGDARRCIITSQNHGYAVRPNGLADDWRVWFVNGNDHTIEGIRHRHKPFLGVQFHPEAHPGPTDAAYIFDEFLALVRGNMR